MLKKLNNPFLKMPPKKPSVAAKNGKKFVKDQRNKSQKEAEPETDLPQQDSLASIIEKDLDLIAGLNEDFFAKANKVCKIKAFK